MQKKFINNVLNTSILINPSKRFFAIIKAKEYNIDKNERILLTSNHNLSVVPLMPHDEKNFFYYKKLLTTVGVFNTSSWMMAYFGKEVLNITNQEEANHFFKDKNDALQKQYTELTKENPKSKIGYYAVVNDEGYIVGGCSLAPVAKSQIQKNVTSADLALHIMPEYQKHGYGGDLTGSLLQKAFCDFDLKSVVGTSLKSNYGTSNLCQQFGMIIKSNKELKYYYINREMWKCFLESQSNGETEGNTALGVIFTSSENTSKIALSENKDENFKSQHQNHSSPLLTKSVSR